MFHVKHSQIFKLIIVYFLIILILLCNRLCVSRETLLLKCYFILINNLNILKSILKRYVSRETLLIKCYFILINNLNKL